MKATGIIRKVDPLGRIVLPIELRRTLDINIKDSLEIFVDEDKVILKKYSPQRTCLLTGDISEDNFSLADGKITVSKEAAVILLEELEKHFVKR